MASRSACPSVIALIAEKRSGSAFAAQARWPDTDVTLTGDAKTWVRTADSGHRATHRFCPHCGSTVAYEIEGWPDVIGWRYPGRIRRAGIPCAEVFSLRASEARLD